MECIGQGSARTNWQIYFNSPPLQSVFCEYYVHYNWAQLSTRTHYGVYPASSNYTLWQWKLSTRTLYGVYLFVILNILASRSFQLALTTECIKRRNAQRKTIYFFNSHPLRSVSSHKGICSYVRYLSTRTRYEVYHLWSRCFCPL